MKYKGQHNKFDQEREKSKFDREEQKNHARQEWNSNMHSQNKAMSRGAQYIARIIKCRSCWGSKQLWGNKKKEQ